MYFTTDVIYIYIDFMTKRKSFHDDEKNKIILFFTLDIGISFIYVGCEIFILLLS